MNNEPIGPMLRRLNLRIEEATNERRIKDRNHGLVEKRI